MKRANWLMCLADPLPEHFVPPARREAAGERHLHCVAVVLADDFLFLTQ
jgi:hypothetical protein